MSHTNGSIVSINVSAGGVPKTQTPKAWISTNGVADDDHEDKRHHGGPDQAVCIYAAEIIESLRAEGHPIGVGTTGENLTVSRVSWDEVQPGSVWKAGDAVLQITSFTSPCKTIRESFSDRRYKRISQKLHPGWSRVYARVLEEGMVEVGDAFHSLRDRPPTGPEALEQ